MACQPIFGDGFKEQWQEMDAAVIAFLQKLCGQQNPTQAAGGNFLPQRSFCSIFLIFSFKTCPQPYQSLNFCLWPPRRAHWSSNAEARRRGTLSEATWIPRRLPYCSGIRREGRTLNNDSEFLRTDLDLEINGETEDEYTRVPWTQHSRKGERLLKVDTMALIPWWIIRRDLRMFLDFNCLREMTLSFSFYR